ncbi:hypothetical protein [Oceanobacter kriegii]|nr:hypothetical protein [Oceanobacter kriegii]
MDIPTLCSADLVVAAKHLSDGMFHIGFGIALAGLFNGLLRK